MNARRRRSEDPHTRMIRAWRAWRNAADRGYSRGYGRGEWTHPADLARVDARIATLRARYDRAVIRAREDCPEAYGLPAGWRATPAGGGK